MAWNDDGYTIWRLVARRPYLVLRVSYHELIRMHSLFMTQHPAEQCCISLNSLSKGLFGKVLIEYDESRLWSAQQMASLTIAKILKMVISG